MTFLGFDIGGANIKVSDGRETHSEPFPLWQNPFGLAPAIARLLLRYSHVTSDLAVTMTGELADCFATKAEGVTHILDAVHAAQPGRPMHVWQTSGEFCTPREAGEYPRLVAAANWHALATWAGRMAPTGNSLLIDVGSTTTDVIPIEDGLPAPIGRTDPERLASGELLYLGVRRTPLCALAGEIEIAGRCQGLARELFATTCDVWLTLGELPEEPAQTQTANGRPATRPDAEDRLARMFCADRTETNSLELLEMCRFYADRQVDLVRRSIRQVLARWEQPPLRVLFAGEGEFLARRAWHGLPEENPPSELLSLSMILGSEHSQGACAYALSRLASERF